MISNVFTPLSKQFRQIIEEHTLYRPLLFWLSRPLCHFIEQLNIYALIWRKRVLYQSRWFVTILLIRQEDTNKNCVVTSKWIQRITLLPSKTQCPKITPTKYMMETEGLELNERRRKWCCVLVTYVVPTSQVRCIGCVLSLPSSIENV